MNFSGPILFFFKTIGSVKPWEPTFHRPLRNRLLSSVAGLIHHSEKGDDPLKALIDFKPQDVFFSSSPLSDYAVAQRS